ncbi:unnamed protein product [Pipistrellus nathusii]|uniref:Secreted protein n=1 Tax=Pipistrellus nathusii TaxID=59473 RepID=A0ABN9ZAF7_PIPNA
MSRSILGLFRWLGLFVYLYFSPTVLRSRKTPDTELSIEREIHLTEVVCIITVTFPRWGGNRRGQFIQARGRLPSSLTSFIPCLHHSYTDSVPLLHSSFVLSSQTPCGMGYLDPIIPI